MTKIIAHRGSKGTHPENTIVAFREAVASRADGIELDVQLTKDNQLVVIHDGTVDRTTNGSGAISELTLAEIQGLDAGSWFSPVYAGESVPSFDEVLSYLQGVNYQGVLNIEVKTDEKDYPGIEERVVSAINAERRPFTCWYSSFNLGTLEKLAVLDPEKPLAYIMYAESRDALRVAALPYIKGLHPKITWLRQDETEALSYPLPLRPWTVNRAEDMAWLMELEVDGFHTDYPRKAREIKELVVREDNSEK